MTVSRDRPPLGRDLVATLAVTVWSIAAVLVLRRAFEGTDALVDAVVLVVTGHGVSFALRRAGTPGWASVPLVGLALVLVTVWTVLPDTTGVFFAPTGETWDRFVELLGEVRAAFPDDSAPVPYADGWAMLAIGGVALTVWFTDTFAFAADARAETLVPGGLFFVFVSVLGDGDGGVTLAAVLVGTGVATVAALRARLEPDPTVVLPRGRRWRPALVPATLCVALLVGAAASALGPRLPGAGEPPLVETTGRSGGVTEVVSPLVDIRSRLVELSSQQAFRVSSTEESYWRLTTLPEFDGTTFRLPTRSLERADGTLTSRDRPGGIPIRQEIEIAALGGRLVPAAADPVEASGRDLRWNPDTSTLVTVGGDLAPGDRFSVVSSSPRVSTEQLRAVGPGVDIDPIHLQLPTDFPDSVRVLAREVAGDAPTAYDTALALQDWFRSEFEYSLEVRPGHGTSAIEDFLEARIGYCEQFSATFAAMGRSLGLPTRVAVGYTAGNRFPDGSFEVLGRHAHAWPEVWFGPLGWIPFEPTPGRGAPGTEQYTGVAPAQDTAGAPDPTEGDEPIDAPTGPSPAPDLDPLLPDLGDPSAGQSTPGTIDDSGLRNVEVPWRALGIVALVAALLGAPAMSRRLARARLVSAPPERRIRTAWADAVAAAARGGVAASPSMTPNEWVDATRRSVPPASRPMQELANVVERVVYGRPGSVDLDARSSLGTDVAQDCAAWSFQVRRVVRERLPWRRRIAAHFTTWR